MEPADFAFMNVFEMADGVFCQEKSYMKDCSRFHVSFFYAKPCGIIFAI